MPTFLGNIRGPQGPRGERGEAGEPGTVDSLFPYPYVSSDGRVHNGVRYSVDDNGVITATGTATGNSFFYISANVFTSERAIELEAGEQYTLSCDGSVPNAYLALQKLTESGGTSYIGTGDGPVTFTALSGIKYLALIAIRSGTTVNSMVFKPMLNKGTVAHPYQYSKISRINIRNDVDKKITEQDALDAIAESTIGENILPHPYYDGPLKTVVGIDYVVNSDLSVTANGTCTSSTASFVLAHATNRLALEPGVSYAISGCPAGGSTTSYNVRVYIYNSDGGLITTVTDFGSGAVFVAEDNYSYAVVYIRITSGYTANNLTFYPMLEKSKIIHEYQPPSLSRVSLNKFTCTAGLSSVRYVDKVNGNDLNDGTTPETAFASVDRYFEELIRTDTHAMLSLYLMGNDLVYEVPAKYAVIWGGAPHVTAYNGNVTLKYMYNGGIGPRYYMSHVNMNTSSDDYTLTIDAESNGIYFEGCASVMTNVRFAVPVDFIGGSVNFNNCTFTRGESNPRWMSDTDLKVAIRMGQTNYRIYGNTNFNVSIADASGIFFRRGCSGLIEGTVTTNSLTRTKPFIDSDHSRIISSASYSIPGFTKLFDMRASNLFVENASKNNEYSALGIVRSWSNTFIGSNTIGG